MPSDARPPLQPGYLAIDLPALALAQRTAAWKAILAAHQLYVRDPDELADRYGLGPGTIHRVCARVGEAPAAAPDVDRAPELEAAIRQHLETGLRATATRVERLASWSRVVLPPDIQDSVLELIARIKHRRTVYDLWGYDQVLTTSRGVTALFSGAPGTGKTLVASAIANELGMDLFRVDLSPSAGRRPEQNRAAARRRRDGHDHPFTADSPPAQNDARPSGRSLRQPRVKLLTAAFDTTRHAILTTNFGRGDTTRPAPPFRLTALLTGSAR
jgi:hypothetical protein